MIRVLLSALVAIGALIFLVSSSDAALAERRVALVVGNSQYKNSNAVLGNPRNDARDVSEVLRTLGFEVVLTVDADKREFDRSLQQFARLASDADAALFFFAGHAMQHQGRNYLMPIDAELEDEISLPYQMVSFDAVNFALDRAKGVKIIILDACRNNPVANRFVRAVFGGTRDLASARGLARIDKTQGMVVSYATGANEVAEDGKARNSPYTTALLKRMHEAGLEIEMMFRRVAQDVTTHTNGRQRPETVISLLSEFYLNRLDAETWEKIKDGDEPDPLRAFIARFPSSALALNAKYRLDAIELTERVRAERAKAERELERLEKERLAREHLQGERETAERREAERKIAEAEARLAALAAQKAASAAPVGSSRDEAAWEFLKESSDSVALKRFVEQFPKSALRPEAEKRIAVLAALPPPPKPADISPEEITWSLVKDTKDIDQLRRFIEQFPNSARQKDAEQRIAALTADAAQANKPTPAFDRQEIARSLQLELKRVGCFDGAVDGEFSGATRAALRNFIKFAAIKLPQDELTPDALKAIRDFSKRVCPLVCPSNERAEGDRCIRIVVAKPSAEPKRKATPAPERKVTAKVERQPRAPRAPSAGSKCFAFQGRQFCE